MVIYGGLSLSQSPFGLNGFSNTRTEKGLDAGLELSQSPFGLNGFSNKAAGIELPDSVAEVTIAFRLKWVF